jgi:hypothetical protein
MTEESAPAERARSRSPRTAVDPHLSRGLLAFGQFLRLQPKTLGLTESRDAYENYVVKYKEAQKN